MLKSLSMKSRIVSLIGTALIAGSAALVATPAAAQLYQASGSLTQTQSMQFGNAASVNYGAGAISVSASSNLSNPFYVYCIDPLNYTNFPSNYATTSLSNFVTSGSPSLYTTLFTSGNYAQSQYTSGNYKVQNTTTVFNNLTSLYSHAYADSLTSTTKSAAFQFAVWSILGEDTSLYSTTLGGLKLVGSSLGTAFQTQADAYLKAVTGAVAWSSVNGTNLTATTSYTYTVYDASPLGSSQTFLRVTAAPPSNSTPEPASLALTGLAVAGMAVARRRKAAKA